MKVLYLADASSIHTVRWIQHFAKIGWEVHLMSFSNLNEKIDRVKSYKIPFNFLKKINYLVMIPYIKKIAKQIQPDIIHAHYLTSYGGIAGRLGFGSIILSAWGSDVLISLIGKGFYSKFLRWFTSRSLNNAVAITSESEVVKNALVGYLGVEKQKVFVFPWGIDTSIFYPGYKNSIELWRKKLNIADGYKVILSPRSMKPGYNIELIIRSIPYIVKDFPDLVFVFLCGNRDPDYYSYIKNLAKQLEIEEKLRFIENYLTTVQISEILNMSNILISIPSSDSIPISVIEGMGCNVIPICSRIEANLELKEKGANIIFTDLKPDNIAQTLLNVLNSDDKFLSDIVEQNYSQVKSQYSWENSCEMMEKIYLDVYRKKNKKCN